MIIPTPYMTTKPSIYQSVFASGRKSFALLIDPGKQTTGELETVIHTAGSSGVDVILVGGSLTSSPVDVTIDRIRQLSNIPVVLFPGSLLQLSDNADAILLLSLLSGRNPEYLIGNHVLAAQFLKKSGMEIIPTGYILVDGHSHTSVEYISNTRPIPASKSDIVVATALAGEQLGQKLIYLEAGSGAGATVRDELVRVVKSNINIPVIVGGGIRTPQDVHKLYEAGASCIVAGTVVEDDYTTLTSLAAVKGEFNG